MNFEFDNVYKIFLKRMNEIEKNLELVNYKGKFLIEIKKNKDTELKEVKEYIRLVEETYNSVMEYNALIISIYGCLENFIDDLLKEYLMYLEKIHAKYENLPSKMKEVHVKNIGDFLQNSQRFSKELDVTQVIRKLYSCFSDGKYNLNYEFILRHGGNLKIDKICELFNNVGIENLREKIWKSEEFIEYFKEENQFENYGKAEEFIKKKNDKNALFVILEDLIERRNIVAHSWGDEQRVSLEEIKNKILKFIKVLCYILYNIVLFHYIRELLRNDKLEKCEVEKIKIYKNEILCFTGIERNFKKNDFIYITSNKEEKILKIENIRCKDRDYDNVDIEKKCVICIKLSGRIGENQKFYFLK